MNMRDAMALARSAASSSNDPYTSVGCVVLNQNGVIVTSKSNRIPDRVVYSSRKDKNLFAIHAEMNAIMNSGFADLRDSTFVTWIGGGFRGFPCDQCAKHIIAVGCRHVLVNPGLPHSGLTLQQSIAEDMFRRVDIKVTEVDIER